ncbi:hypothetical protein B0H13DRAFT_2001424 [Mycena leptocephala]|nr:hypothetical protein B0H13DRAFT_2001424 [Mycena leptocephala]
MSIVSGSTIPGYVLRYRSHAMDGIYSIVAGLVLRVVVDAATFHNVKLSGTLIGLWEGVVLLHYVNKAPSSSDPYLAYGSIFKLVIVLLWSTMGMVLADVAPAVWVDTGLKRQWSRVRRDLYRSARMFSKRRTTVRFVTTPTIASVSSVGSTTTVPASTTAPPESSIIQSPTTPVAPVHRPIVIRRRSSVPGTFPGAELSETDTDAGTLDEYDEDEDAPVPTSQSSHVTISRIIPLEPSEDSYTFTTSPRSSSPAYSLEYSDDPSASNPVDIPSDVEDEILVHPNRRRTHSDRETTPKQMVVVLPPTPSESLQDWESSHGGDGAEDPLDEWETVNAEDEAPPTPPPKNVAFESVSTPEQEMNDDTSVAAASTIAADPVPDEANALIDDASAIPPVAMPVPEPTPALLTSDPTSDPTPPTTSTTIPDPDPAPPAATSEDQTSAQPTLDPVAPETAPAAEPGTAQDLLPPTADIHRTPPPSFEDLYGPDPEPTADPRAASQHATSRSATPPPIPSPIPSLKNALSLRKEALEIKARIAALSRQRKTSLSEGNSAATAAAVLAKIEIERAEKEFAQVNEKAAGAFVGAYNPPTASLYEFNTTGLTPEEAVQQTESRLETLLLTPVPPAGTRPEDLAHDSPNRGALKVTMEQTIKGRLVKQALLLALDDNGLNWMEEPTRPNVVFVMLPVTAAAEEATPAAADEPPPKKEEEDDTKEY